MIHKIVTLLEGLLHLNRAVEGLLVDIIASYSPWIAPLPPAYMTYTNMVHYLGFPHWAGLAGAVCVETLGLSAIQTAVSFWQWNGARQKTEPRAPVIMAVLVGGFYLATVLTVNAMLDNSPSIYRLAKALLSSLSVCAGVVLALRAGHARRVTEAEQARQERKAERATLRAERRAAQAVNPAGETANPLLQPAIYRGNGNGTRKMELTR